MKRLLLLLSVVIVSLAFFSGCGGRQDEEFFGTSSTIEIDIPPCRQCGTLDSIVIRHRKIQLRSDSEMKIGIIDGIAVQSDGDFVVWDRQQRKCVARYDSSGHFKCMIGRNGRGPGEYVEPTDVIVSDSTILVFDMYSHTLSSYSDDGKFIGNTNLKPMLHEFESSADSDRMVFVGGDNRRDSIAYKELLLIDKEGEVVRCWGRNKYKMNYSNGYSLSHYRDEVIYHKALNNNIISIGCDFAPFVKYHLRFGPSELPDHYEKECSGDFGIFRKRFMNNSFVYFDGRFWEQDRFVLIGFSERGVPGLCFFDKQKHEAVSYFSGISYSRGERNPNSVLLWAMASTANCFRDNKGYFVVNPSTVSELAEEVGGLSIIEIVFQ